MEVTSGRRHGGRLARRGEAAGVQVVSQGVARSHGSVIPCVSFAVSTLKLAISC